MKKTVLILMIIGVTINSCKKEVITTLPEKTVKVNGIQGLRINPIACGQTITLTKDLQLDFGAMGNGMTDDTDAFLEAADWINANWNPGYAIELYIPPGTYKVGLQLAPSTTHYYGSSGSVSNPPGGYELQGIDILQLNGAENVYIHGAGVGATQIVYHDNLSFGGMLSGGAANNYVPGKPCHSGGGPSNAATVGTFLMLNKCRCITVEGLSVEGNATNCLLKGKYGECNGYQLPYDGINIFGGSDIEISGMDCVNFGRDGLMTVYDGGNPTNITLDNVNCTGNSRQGFSFTAGDNIQATDCKFNSTGWIFYNNPGAGMDIEPESGGTCVNSTFTRCEFKDNNWVGMVSDDHYPDVDAITFDNCEFSASLAGSWSIWPKRMGHTTFYQCTIRGQMAHVAGISTVNYNRIQFTMCNITDWNGSASNPVSGWNSFLMNFGASYPDNSHYAFSACNFDIHHSKLIYTDVGSSSTVQVDERLFEGCTFNFDYADMQSTVNYYGGTLSNVPFPSLGHFIHCTLNSNTFTENSPVSSAPANHVCYWIGMTTSYWSGVDNLSGGANNFPQDGIGSNPWTRVTRNPNWPGSHLYQRATF